ncbi:Edc3 protein [Maudiozyma humilis]|uniref:Enhancer of mRNA-decapping protein 3 n=1 Tax=Maudiozyma humilis TaxID=51915 RepID=A0AAV5RZT2_MAUHU|nr:Edc3 protein [Kazachstania humilis]
MSDHSQFTGYKVQLELRDGKRIDGTIVKATAKGLSLSDVTFGDGGTSQAFKVRSSRLRDLTVLGVPSRASQQRDRGQNTQRQRGQRNSSNNNNGYNGNNKSGSNSREGTSTPRDWQDDDVKQIKNGADFDFQENLTRFNKKDVFAQLKQQDEVDPGHRLVAVNKRGSPGSDGITNKVNYEYDEMVIPNAKQDMWDKVDGEFDAADKPAANDNNEDDKDDEIEDFESATDDDEDEVDDSTRSNSTGRPAGKSSTSSAGTNVLDEDDTEDDDDEFEDAHDDAKYFPITKAINITHLLHSAVEKDGSTTPEGADKAQILSQLEQMLIGNASGSNSGSLSLGSGNGTNSPGVNTAAQLPVLSNVRTKQTIPTASPIELLEIERLTNESAGVSTETMNEVFGLNASYLVKSHLGGSSRLTVRNSNPEPLIVILISETNRAGARAVALARYLTQLKQVRVVIMFSCPLNDIQDRYVLARLEVFKRSGGKIVNSVKNLVALLAKLNSPVELIVDAMQGFDSNLGDFALSRSTRQKTNELVGWCNEMRATSKGVKVWSLDLPSGYDSSSGLQNFDVAIARTDKVLCAQAWPLTCLRAMGPMLGAPGTAGKAAREEDCPVVLVDCGIPSCVYAQKNSLRKFSNVDTFVASGTVGLTL